MTINVKSGSGGWSKYVLEGTEEKPREQQKVKLIDGNPKDGDYYSKANKYKESYYKGVIAFEGKPTNEKMIAAYNDFKEQFFKGFRSDEYHIDAVIHKDTENYHIHFRIPKQNLLTNTHLQLYMHKIDAKRLQLIQDYISLKQGFNIAREKNTTLTQAYKSEATNINKKAKEEVISLSSKPGKEKATKILNKLVLDNIQNCSKKEDLTKYLEEKGVKVLKYGKDYKKGFAYVTVQKGNSKLRLKGDMFEDAFFKQNKQLRDAQARTNTKSNIDTLMPTEVRLKQVKSELSKENKKRFEKVRTMFKSARNRALEDNKKIKNAAAKEQTPTVKRKENEDENTRTAATRGIRTKRESKHEAYRQAAKSRGNVYREITGAARELRKSTISNSTKLSSSHSKFRERFEFAVNRVKQKINKLIEKIKRPKEQVKQQPKQQESYEKATAKENFTKLKEMKEREKPVISKKDLDQIQKDAQTEVKKQQVKQQER